MTCFLKTCQSLGLSLISICLANRSGPIRLAAVTEKLVFISEAHDYSTQFPGVLNFFAKFFGWLDDLLRSPLASLSIQRWSWLPNQPFLMTATFFVEAFDRRMGSPPG